MDHFLQVLQPREGFGREMDVAVRRLRAEDIEQVIDIEREAFSPLWLGTSFKRDLNNRYARYLVACRPEFSDIEAEAEFP